MMGAITVFKNTRAAAFMTALALTAGCAGSDDLASVSFREFTTDVLCESDGTCVDGDGRASQGRDIACEGFMSRQASSFAPQGLFLFWSYESGGRYVEVELDFPTDAVGQVPSIAVLREYARGCQVFQTDLSRGMVNLVRAASEAPSLAGSFELMFVDFGQDGVEGTGDDEIRFLRHGTFAVSRHAFQATETHTDYYYDFDYRHTWDTGVVLDIWISPDWGDETSEYYAYDEAEGCEGDTWDDTNTVDDHDGEGGCEGDTYDSGHDEYDSGCGDETWGDDDTGGCESDSDYDSGSGGCDSDWDSDSGGCDFDCEGDTTYGKAKSRKGGGTSLAGLLPVFIPFLLRGLLGSRRKKT
jgi:hypothetical protein